MQTVKPRARYLHAGNVVAWVGKWGAANWYFYDITLDAALARLHEHHLRHQTQPVLK